jgi:hypothetical protein
MKKVLLTLVMTMALIAPSHAEIDGAAAETPDGLKVYWNCGDGVILEIHTIKEPKIWWNGFYLSFDKPVTKTIDYEGEVVVPFKIKWNFYTDKIYVNGLECIRTAVPE